MRRVGVSSIPGGRRTFVAAGIVCVALLAVAATPQLLGSDVRRAFEGLEHARPVWLWAAAVGFLGALLCNAWVWRSAIQLCGGQIDRARAVACYGVGSLVNTALPARVGDAARIALFSRSFGDARDRYWTTGSVFGAIGAARALVLAVLVVVGAVLVALPLWPVLVLGGLAGVAARVGGTAAIGAALGVSDPVLAALIIVPTLDLATTIPLTPGNIGIGTGTVAMALQSRGVDLTKALTTGIALQAIETAVSIVVGAGGALYLARFGSGDARRRALAVGRAARAVVLVGSFSATFLADLGCIRRASGQSARLA